MSDERITTYETPGHTTVIHEGPARSGSGGGWLLGIVALIAVLAAVYLLAVRGDSQTARDNAIAQAANQVATAANQVGDAAQDAASNLHK